MQWVDHIPANVISVKLSWIVRSIDQFGSHKETFEVLDDAEESASRSSGKVRRKAVVTYID